MKWLLIALFVLFLPALAVAGTLNIQTPTISATGAVTCNWVIGPYCRIFVNQPVSMLNLQFPADGLTYTIEFDQDSIGHFITLPSNIVSATSGPQPIPATTANAVTVWMMTYNANKNTYQVQTGNGSGGTFSGVSTDNSLTGAGTPNNQLGIAAPVTSANGGTGVSAPIANTVPVAAGFNAFTFLGPLAEGQIVQGTGPSTPPIITSNYTVGLGGHLQAVSSPPTATNCGTGAVIIGADSIFQISIGSGTVTSCQVNFQKTMPGGSLCLVLTSQNPPQFTTTNQITYVSDPSGLGRFITLQGLSPGADIGCELATVLCIEVVLP